MRLSEEKLSSNQIKFIRLIIDVVEKIKKNSEVIA